MGILAVVCAPMVGKAVERFDARLIICAGIVGIGLMNVWRMGFNSDVTFLKMALPTLLMGPFMVMFFVPVTGLAMASVAPHEQANAAGLSNFMRTLAGAFATSLVQTGWSNATRTNNTELAGAMTHGNTTVDAMVAAGATPDQAIAGLDQIVQGQSVMLATLNMFAVLAIVFAFSALLIWIAPRPKGPIDTSGAH
jgi:DHA2 family multidrug resistance protein